MIKDIFEQGYEVSQLLSGIVSNEEKIEMYGIVYCVIKHKDFDDFEFEIIRSKI